MAIFSKGGNDRSNDKTTSTPASRFFTGKDKAGYTIKKDGSATTLGARGKSMLALDKKFKAPRNANALSKSFDNYNGDFDTLSEFVIAYMKKDARALRILKMQNFEQLENVLENMSSEIKEFMNDRMEEQDYVFKKYINEIEERQIPTPFSKPKIGE